jgi:hypothetical protein
VLAGAAVLASLVGEGTGAATRVGTGLGESHGATGLLVAGAVGTGDGEQLAVGLRGGGGAGAAVWTRLGRELATGLGGSVGARGPVGAADGAAGTGAGVPVAGGLAGATGEAVPSADAAVARSDAPDDA